MKSSPNTAIPELTPVVQPSPLLPYSHSPPRGAHAWGGLKGTSWTHPARMRPGGTLGVSETSSDPVNQTSGSWGNPPSPLPRHLGRHPPTPDRIRQAHQISPPFLRLCLRGPQCTAPAAHPRAHRPFPVRQHWHPAHAARRPAPCTTPHSAQIGSAKVLSVSSR
jgi:hypothetical protein